MSRQLLAFRVLLIAALLVFSVSFVSAQEPQTGGSIVWAADSMGDTLENGIWTGFGSVNVLDNIGEGLVRVDFSTGQPVGALAESWTVSDDGLVYTFNLRDGVVFSDGTPVTAEAVVRSLTRDTATEDPAYVEGMYMFPAHGTSNWESVTAPDADTVVMTLIAPDATQPAKLSRPSAYIYSPATLDAGPEAVGTAPVFAGAFKIDRFVPGQEVVLSANESYWAGRPYLDQLIIRAYPDEASILTALEAGEVDITTSAPFLAAPRLSQTEGYRVEVGGPLVSLFIGINVANPPFDRLEIRQAVNAAINRDTLIAGALSGYGLAPAGLLGPLDVGYDESLMSASAYDPATATALIAESGLTTPIPVNLSFENNRFWPAMAELIALDLEAVGFDVTLDPLDSGSFWGKVGDSAADEILTESDPSKMQLSINQRSTFIADPDDRLQVLDAVRAQYGQANYQLLSSSEAFTQLLADGLASTDVEARTAIYAEANNILLNDLPYVYLAYLTPPVFVTERVQNIPVNAAAAGRVSLREVWVSG
ncbi:MAG: ABC transporter substrate-binding protein [Chloroflexota bacterium]|nr:ABC transporter substrate-binding protein [Chloroflexota bacterium]